MAFTRKFRNERLIVFHQKFAFNTPNLLAAPGITLGNGELVSVPVGAKMVGLQVAVLTAFDSAATLRLGFNDNGTDWINGQSLTATGVFDLTGHLSVPNPLDVVRSAVLRVTGTPTVGVGAVTLSFLR